MLITYKQSIQVNVFSYCVRYTYCSANFPVCAHSTQTRKFVLQGAQGGPSEKISLIELRLFTIKLVLETVSPTNGRAGYTEGSVPSTAALTEPQGKLKK